IAPPFAGGPVGAVHAGTIEGSEEVVQDGEPSRVAVGNAVLADHAADAVGAAPIDEAHDAGAADVGEVGVPGCLGGVSGGVSAALVAVEILVGFVNEVIGGVLNPGSGSVDADPAVGAGPGIAGNEDKLIVLIGADSGEHGLGDGFPTGASHVVRLVH